MMQYVGLDVQQQYGQNFGHSVFPYRPPSPVYSSGLGRR
jgi:hypothetical protein